MARVQRADEPRAPPSDGSPDRRASRIRRLNIAAATTSARASVGEWVQTALLALNLVWTTLCLGGYRADTMVITSGLTGALLAAHGLTRACSGQTAPPHVAGWALVPFLLYAAANVIWVSPVPWLGWIDWFWWAQMAAVFWVVLDGIRTRGPRQALFFTLVALAFSGVALGCYQRFVSPHWLPFGETRSPQYQGRASGSFGIPNSLAALLLLLLPAVGAIAARRHARATERVGWGWVGLVLAFGLVLTISRGAWIALALALTLWPLLAGRSRWPRRLRIAAIILTGVAATAAVVITTSPKAAQRFSQLARDGGERSRPVVWRAAWQLFRAAPVLGTGAASYNLLFEKHRPEGFLVAPQWVHNDYLNTLSDYGAVGAMLCFGAWMLIAGGCARHSRESAPREHDWLDGRLTSMGLAVGLLAFSLQLVVDFHLKIPALAMAFGTVAALVVSRLWPGRPPRPTTALRRSRDLAVVAAVCAMAFVLMPMFRAEGLRDRARRSIDRLAATTAVEPDALRRPLSAARADLSLAVATHPANGQAWADLAYAISLWAHVENGRDRQLQLGREAERAAEQALSRSTACPEFWIRRGVARDLQGDWLQAGNDFAEALALAPNHPLPWFHHADHLSRRSSERRLAEAALAFCLRLDPENAAALALRQRLAIGTRAP